MGANLCGLRGSSHKQLPAVGCSKGPQPHNERSFIDRIEPDCLKVEKREQLHQVEMKVGKVAMVERVTLEEWLLASPAMVERVTLEEWLLASPAMRRDGIGINAGEIQVSKQANNRICPWITSPSPYVEIRSHFSRARNSFTLERSKKAEETAQEGMISPRLSRDQSGKLKKRVSFRLPEEADIIFFYSPEGGVTD